MFIDFHKLISRGYLVDIDPIMLHRSDKGLLIVGGVLVILGIIFRMVSLFAPHSYAKKLWRQLSTWGLTIGLLEALWFGLRYQNVRILGSHVAAFLVLLIGLIWLLPLVKYRFGQYRRNVVQWQKDQVKQKYLQR